MRTYSYTLQGRMAYCLFTIAGRSFIHETYTIVPNMSMTSRLIYFGAAAAVQNVTCCTHIHTCIAWDAYTKNVSHAIWCLDIISSCLENFVTLFCWQNEKTPAVHGFFISFHRYYAQNVTNDVYTLARTNNNITLRNIQPTSLRVTEKKCA